MKNTKLKQRDRRKLNLFFNHEARKSAADALKKASWLSALAGGYFGFDSKSVAYAIVVGGVWLVLQGLATLLLSIEERDDG